MSIQKTTFTVTVLHDATENPRNMELETVLEQMDMGDFIGSVHVGDTVDIPNETVREELEAIGNDGTFFQMEETEITYKNAIDGTIISETKH